MIRFLLAVLLMAAPVLADTTFMSAYDLSSPTEAADNDQLIASTALLNTTTYVVIAQPDVPRNVTITVTDTTPSITAGTITVNCLDVNGVAFTEVLNLAGPTLTFTGTKVCASATTVVTASVVTLGGVGDETFIVGTGSVVGYTYCATPSGTTTCGTGVTAGWLDASDAWKILVAIDVLTLTATGGVDYTIECRGTGQNTQPRTLLAGNIASALIPGVPSSTLDPFVITEACASLRVGVKYGTTDTAGTDSISAFIRTQK